MGVADGEIDGLDGPPAAVSLQLDDQSGGAGSGEVVMPASRDPVAVVPGVAGQHDLGDLHQPVVNGSVKQDPDTGRPVEVKRQPPGGIATAGAVTPHDR